MTSIESQRKIFPAWPSGKNQITALLESVFAEEKLEQLF